MSKTINKPFMSVVICTYNSEAVISRAIESLLAQDYPKDRYEIIVVDDGCQDRTVQIVKHYPVQLVRHRHNQGLAAARNTGLTAATGDVYVSFDDDCVVAPNWLSQLALGYHMPDAAGVGSIMQEPSVLHGVVDRFMAAVGSGNPPSLRLDSRSSNISRFTAYVADNLAPEKPAGEIYRVRQLNGATATFAIDLLRSVGGWDSTLRAAEDTDLCTRIAKAYPQRHFYAVANARLIHDPKMSLRTFIRRPYVRGLPNLMYYRRNGLTPPVFPFPLIWLGAMLASLLINPVLSLACIIVLPQLLYIWWPIRAFREQNPWNLVFTYLQLVEEACTVAGLVRGYIVLKQGSRHA